MNLIAQTFDTLARRTNRVRVPALGKQIAAVKLAIEVLESERCRRFAAGEHAWQEGIRTHEINEDGITGVQFAFAEDGHKGYVQYSDAIGEMEDMLEALQDADVTTAEPLPLFQEVE